MTGPLREITYKSIRTGPRRFCGLRGWAVRTSRSVRLTLACGHVLAVPFGDRPKVGARKRCAQCALDARLE